MRGWQDVVMDTSTPSGPLVELAHAHGVATDYWDWQGRAAPVAAETVVAILCALDVPATTDDEVSASLADVSIRAWRRTLPPTVVCREGWTPWVPVHVRHGSAVDLVIELEDGSVREASHVERLVDPTWVDGTLMGEATFELPGDLLARPRPTTCSPSPIHSPVCTTAGS